MIFLHSKLGLQREWHLFFSLATNFTFRGWKRLLVTWCKQCHGKVKAGGERCHLESPRQSNLVVVLPWCSKEVTRMNWKALTKQLSSRSNLVWFWKTAHYIFAWWFQGKPYGRAYKLHHIFRLVDCLEEFFSWMSMEKEYLSAIHDPVAFHKSLGSFCCFVWGPPLSSVRLLLIL